MIKSVTTPSPKLNQSDFPCLLKLTNADVIALMCIDKETVAYSGQVVYSTHDSYKVGYYSDNWNSNEGLWEKYIGNVVLSNT